MIPRPDLLDEHSPQGLEVFQLTTDRGLSGCHLYMEAQIFAPDSERFILHVGTDAHGSGNRTPDHQYLRCDLRDGGALHPMTFEFGATAPSVSPDGRYVYYLVDESQLNGGRITLKRINLDGTDRVTLAVIDRPVDGAAFQPSRLYPLSTISSDGRRLAISCFLGDGHLENAPFGLLVFDLERGTVSLPIQGPTYCNMHPQYCRSPEAPHDLLIQENHGNVNSPRGRHLQLTGGVGADIHVVRDDGSRWRGMPWGRDQGEKCQGHQCWRGQSQWAITGTSEPDGKKNLIESTAFEGHGHEGRRTPGPIQRNLLSPTHPSPHYVHFATDRAGRLMITDHCPRPNPPSLFLMELDEPGAGPVRRAQYLLNTRSSNVKETHVHPFLSPDGRMGFFNSDESGVFQAYMVRGW
jgi:hypothetical protein